MHPTPFVAAPPAVLEPCCHITEIVGTQSSPRPLGYRICGDNIDKLCGLGICVPIRRMYHCITFTHMEHLNRSVKIAIQNLGPNKTEAGITKVGKILRVLVPLLHKFDLENGVSKVSGHHSKPGEDKDIRIILENLSSSLDVIPNQEYRSFHNPTNPLHARFSQDIEKWVVGDIKKKKK